MDQPKQEAITRMSTFQMNLKQLTVAITTGSIFVNMSSWFSNLLVVIILIVLWFLDAYYLGIERTIRKKVDDFGSRKLRDNENMKNNLFSKSVIIFHSCFILISILALTSSICEWF